MTSPAVRKSVVDGVLEKVVGRFVETLPEERDALLPGLRVLEVRPRHG